MAFWMAALISLALTDPANASHFTLCPLKLLGISWCPGCGLGHSISFLFHGDLRSSFHAHWLGIPVVIILFHRVYVLGKARLYPQCNTYPAAFNSPSNCGTLEAFYKSDIFILESAFKVLPTGEDYSHIICFIGVHEGCAV